MQYKFEIVVEVDPEMGFDTAEIVQEHIEEAIRDAGDAGISVKLKILED